MMFVAADLRKIQASVWAAVLMIAAAAAALYFSHGSRVSALLARERVTAEHRESDDKLRQVREEEIEIGRNSILFNKLQERGIIGGEQRLEWVELLKEIQDRRHLVELQYEILPQRLLDGKAASNFAFHASTMKLQLQLLHEEDLMRLISDLRSQAKALIRVRSCDLARLPASADEHRDGRANLSAKCEIDWLTLRDVGRK